MSLSTFLRDQRDYRAVFYAHNPPGPWPCHFCGENVDDDPGLRRHQLQIHHLDEDRSNSDPANLVPAHSSCHHRHHALSGAASKAGRAAQARLTPEERSEAGRHANKVYVQRTTAEERFKVASERGRLGGLAGGRRGGASRMAALTPEERSALSAHAHASTPTLECPRCGRRLKKGPYTLHVRAHERKAEVAA